MLSKSEILVLISNSRLRQQLTALEQKMGLVRDTEAAVLAKLKQQEPMLDADEFKALARFCETCEDGEGYDVPKEMMKRLARIGVVNRVTFGMYELTKFGQSVIDAAPVQQEQTELEADYQAKCSELELIHEVNDKRIAELESTLKVALEALKHLHHNAKKSRANMGLALDVASDAIKQINEVLHAE